MQNSKLVNWEEGLEAVNMFNENLKQDKEISKRYFEIAGVNGYEQEAKNLWKQMNELRKERVEMLKR